MDWTIAVYWLMDWTWALGGAACLALASLCALGENSFASLEKKSTGTLLRSRAWGLGFPGLIALFKLAQFHSYQSMWDSGVTVNLAWNALHGYGVWSSVIADRSYFSVHFAFLAALLSPVLLLWKSGAALAAVQGFAVGSSILAFHLLVGRETKDPLTPWIASLLALSHPLYQAVVGAVLDSSVYALPLFLWSAYFWESGRKDAATVFGLLLITTREQVPFILVGAGLYAFSRARGRDRWLPTGLIAASILLWAAETAVIHLAQAGWARGVDYWNTYRDLGGSREAVLGALLREPWRFALALFLPPAKLWTPLRVLFHAAFLPLAAGTALLPALLAWLPHQLAPADSAYHALNAHASVFVLGPLLWAAAKGVGRVSAKIAERHRRFFLAALLGVSACGLLGSGRSFYYPGLIPSSWRTAAPKAFARIPEAASVWCDEFFLPQLGLRRYVKTFPQRLPDSFFEPGLFLPDRVLLSLYWAQRADRASRDRILRFLKQRGFVLLFSEQDLLVLANPATLGKEGGPPVRVAIPDTP